MRPARGRAGEGPAGGGKVRAQQHTTTGPASFASGGGARRRQVGVVAAPGGARAVRDELHAQVARAAGGRPQQEQAVRQRGRGGGRH